MKINVRLSQSKIKEIISFTLYSGNAANNGIIIDGGRYKINETCELDISNDNEVYLYVTPSGNSTNYVTINTKNIERLCWRVMAKNYHFPEYHFLVEKVLSYPLALMYYYLHLLLQNFHFLRMLHLQYYLRYLYN